MVAEVITGLGAFKTMLDIAKSMKNMDDAVKRNTAVFDLGEQIIATQARYTAAVEQIRELKEKLAQFETWEREKQRYELTEVATGVFSLLLKPSMRSGQPPHCICAQCYEDRRKSILQITRNIYGSVTLTCPRCKSEITAEESHPNYPFKHDGTPPPDQSGGTGDDFMTR